MNRTNITITGNELVIFVFLLIVALSGRWIVAEANESIVRHTQPMPGKVIDVAWMEQK